MTKKTTKKKVTKKTTDCLILTEKDFAPEKTGTKLALVTPSQMPLSTKQILKIFQRTPKQHVHTRPAKGGGTWDYVTGTYVKKVLNHVFGWLWDFEIMDKGREGNQVWVQGKLTIRDPKTRQPAIVKTQFGGADVKVKKGTKDCLNYANDLKAATTDCLKKCASELGVANDIYGKNEFKDLGVSMDKPIKPVIKPVEEVTYVAEGQSYLEQLKQKLGAKNDTDVSALMKLEKKTGRHWESFKGKSETQAQTAFAELLKANLK
jgi:hypothetical protein